VALSDVDRTRNSRQVEDSITEGARSTRRISTALLNRAGDTPTNRQEGNLGDS